MVFDANGCIKHYTLINAGQTNLVYKIKCNNFNKYQFKPVEGFIGAGETQKIEITRTKGPPGKDLFFLHYAVAPLESKDPQEVCTYLRPIAQIFVNMFAYL
ncbi:MSP domain protein [Ancylostoma duodenale]|uniref:MSP domain protein n=1 Tax=Ancylostoma duodenale TaxID=51022 RepID=A0A0C2D3H1_9BILA|nr:MSP domain protein [Ancylostoma duodenale]